MPKKLIPATEIRNTHPVIEKTHKTDFYYARLAGSLMDEFIKAGVYFDKATTDILHKAAVTLTCYLEDVIADSGQWRMFSERCRQMFGWPVPMYHDDKEEYYPDEPSLMAVRFILWHAATEMTGNWWYADLDELDTLADIAYKRLCDEFEKAPINEQLADDIDDMLKKAENSFYDMQIALVWIFNNCYITHMLNNVKQIVGRMAEYDKYDMGNCDDYWKLQNTFTSCATDLKAGPLALYSREYLATLAEVRSFHKLAEQLNDIEVIPLRAFLYEASDDGKRLLLRCTDDREINVDRQEITLDDDIIKRNNGFAASFVRYLGTWHLNGFVSVLENADKKWEKLRESDPYILKEDQEFAGMDRYLQSTNGERLVFFRNAEDLKDSKMTGLNISPEIRSAFNSKELRDLPIMLFIEEENGRAFVKFSAGYTNCIDAPNNPFYHAISARKYAMDILKRDDCISSQTVLYLLEKDFLPDLLNNPVFSSKVPTKERKADAAFLLRYIRQDNY